MVRSQSSYFLLGMILLSLALGLFISYFFVFVNALFISEIGTSKLAFAYLLSGFGGLFISWVFNSLEKKWGFAKTSTLLGFLFSLVIFLIWYFYIQGKGVYYIIFFAYAWFWISTNFTALVFWKLPSNIFNLEENKKYNSIISSGEGISAIIAYLSVPILLTLDFFTRDKLVLISFLGMFLFSVITFILGKKIKQDEPKAIAKNTENTNQSKNQIFKESYFQLIFYSVIISIIIQFLIDFSLMEVSANQMQDPKQLAQYFSFIFGGMRVIELTLKFFISKYLIREHGVFISLTSLIFALTFTTLIGITSYFTGYLSLILIVASLGKVFERSFYRSIYAPTINLLYQAYPQSKRSLTQNYADGYGKTIGQLIAALFILAFAKITVFETKILTLLLVVLTILIIWFFVSKKLISHYKAELTKILNDLKRNADKKALDKYLTKIENKEENTIYNKSSYEEDFYELTEKLLSFERNALTVKTDSSKKKLWQIKTKNKGNALEITYSFLEKTKNSSLHQLNKLDHVLNILNKKNNSKILELLQLFININIISKNKSFSFHHSQNSLKNINFLYSGVIQNYSKHQIKYLDLRDYYFLLEERIFKYTYLLNCIKEFHGNYKKLDLLLLKEINTTKLEILYCLSLRHEPGTLDQIVTMINKGTKSEELLALELLELMLDEQEKKWILTILKETNPDRVLNRLENDFPQVILGHEDRLISIITSKKLDIPILIKQEALSILNKTHLNPGNRKLVKVLNEYEGKNQNRIPFDNSNRSSADSTYFPTEHKEEFTVDNIEELAVGTSSLSFIYWKNHMYSNGTTNEEEQNLNKAVKLVYTEVFPLEKIEEQ